jgi:aspartyl-tRNA(Asn)/glutamyl-tRNA(Gln) amidotransferase subunit A
LILEIHRLTAAALAVEVRAGAISPIEIVEALLARIRATDAGLQAWETLVPEVALRRARRVANTLKRSGPDSIGPFCGVPFGVKDVIATAGIRTACGFPPFDDRVPSHNADVVAALLAAGGVVLGKTVTTQFAWAQPSRTRNPWGASHTPGGSSSGSAVAVAAGHVPFALGTQTAGSTLRPAAYNGVVGFKPSLGRVSTRGVFPLARTLDHVGCFARSVEDCRLFLRSSQVPSGKLRLGVLREAVERSTSPVAAKLDSAVQTLGAAGAKVQEIRLEMQLAEAITAHRITINFEAARFHSRLMQRLPGGKGGYAPKTLEYIESGNRFTRDAYLQAQRDRTRFTAALADALKSIDAIVLPTVANVAPSLETTGDPSLQTPFTFAGVPAISLPIGLSPEGLPVGMQLVGRLGADEHLLALARWCEQALPPPLEPALHLLREAVSRTSQ